MAAFAEDERNGRVDCKGHCHNAVKEFQGIIGAELKPDQENCNRHPDQRQQMPCGPQGLSGRLLTAE